MPWRSAWDYASKKPEISRADGVACGGGCHMAQQEQNDKMELIIFDTKVTLCFKPADDEELSARILPILIESHLNQCCPR